MRMLSRMSRVEALRRAALPFCGVVMLSVVCGSMAQAGPYADDMAKCLVKSSSADDKSLFMKWLFAAIALHPDVQAMATITPAQRDDLNRRTALLIQKLLTDSCRAAAQQAVRYEGPATIQYAFQVFGQAAAGDLFASPQVAAGMKDLAKYLDKEKLQELAAPSAAK